MLSSIRTSPRPFGSARGQQDIRFTDVFQSFSEGFVIDQFVPRYKNALKLIIRFGNKPLRTNLSK